MLNSTIGAISSISKHATNLTTSYLNPNKTTGLSSLNDQEILKAINALSSMFPKSERNFSIKLPKLITVGSQSAGKSSLICGLIGMNILPTGKQMVTRCPLNLQLLTHFEQKAWAEFGEYRNGSWMTKKKVNLTLPDPTDEEIFNIQLQIKTLTDKLAGSGKNISDKEIILKIYSPNVPNLSLVDLPGLTLVACTDQGQPKDIKHQIRNLISKYIEDEESIILAVMPAREDLETDMALELAKEFDPKGDRTCGILTKIDLMNKNNDVVSYLEDEVSVDLRLKHGYFAINNVRDNSMFTSLQKEIDYFQNNPTYSKLECQNRMGRQNVGKYLSSILIDVIKSNIPCIIEDLMEKEKKIREESAKLGISLLTKTSEEKSAHCHMLISNFCKEFTKALDEKGGLNYGRYVKQHFINYRQDVKSIQYDFDSNYIQEVVHNCNGNHMDFSIFSIEILESCLQDPEQRVFMKLIEPSTKLVRNIIETLTDLVNVLMKNSELARFHNFMNYVKKETGAFLLTLNEDIHNRIRDIVKAEESYIWTDNYEFVQNLKEIFKNVEGTEAKPKVINRLINMYMNTVKITVADQVPKSIMCFMIRRLEENIYTLLFEKLKDQDMDILVSEKPEIEQKRLEYVSQREKLESAKALLHL